MWLKRIACSLLVDHVDHPVESGRPDGIATPRWSVGRRRPAFGHSAFGDGRDD